MEHLFINLHIWVITSQEHIYLFEFESFVLNEICLPGLTNDIWDSVYSTLTSVAQSIQKKRNFRILCAIFRMNYIGEIPFFINNLWKTFTFLKLPPNMQPVSVWCLSNGDTWWRRWCVGELALVLRRQRLQWVRGWNPSCTCCFLFKAG